MSIALYRRYRPEMFADVIGQEHVTEPLTQALRSGRVHHAYLFSGPRGCGKTTSARILARCLNCEQGPTPEPCGTCQSCVALARDGAGSVDVIEIDAASHGRVDDTRELRERAAFGPAASRFKVYIIDEAHMVSREGFNSLLKIVEEPPPHVKFIFATTEPDKVLATIRSRTHHYPFHLVPPARLTAYLEQVCEQEEVQLEPGVLSFVTRAGGGSVRDSLSVLDQLISGAGEAGLTYERAAALLGFTDVELLDAVVEAVAAGDSATVFQQVDRVMESGHDPRRFVEDLLERYRDLIVLAAVGDQVGGLLPGLPQDQVGRMRRQAGSYGAAGLSRAADLTSRGLSEMVGAVSYRLMLELLAARLLLPAASGEQGYGARLDRIERRLGAGPAPGPVGSAGPGDDAGDAGRGGPEGSPGQDGASRGPQAVPSAEVQDGPGTLDVAALRRHWSDIIEAVRRISRRTAGAVEAAQVKDFDGRRLLIAFPAENWVRHFMGTSHEEALRQGVLDALALDVRIEATVQGPDEGGGPPPPSSQDEAPMQGQIRTRAGATVARGRPADTEPSEGRPSDTGPAGDGGSDDRPSMAEQLGAVGGRPPRGEGSNPDWAEAGRSRSAPAWATTGTSATSETSPAPAAQGASGAGAGTGAPSADDEDLTTSGAVGQPVVENVLGGTVIAINDEPVP